MYYHIKVKYDSISESGKSIVKSEEYLVENAELHGEAECKGYEHTSNYKMDNADIVSVKRSNIREMINEMSDDVEDIIYDAVIADVFIDEKNGKEKEMRYHVGVYAKSVEDATKKVNEYMKQGMENFRFISVKETKVVEIL